MKNFVQPGENIEVTAPYDVASGDGCLVGAVFGIASTTVASGKTVTIKRTGVFDIKKAASQAWTAFTTKVYWDNTNKVLTSTSSGNTLVGVAAAAVGAGAGETIGRTLLTGQLS